MSRFFLLLIISSFAAGCGSSSNPAPPPPQQATDGPAVTRGEITGFGSIYVNGRRFNTSNATFKVDGNPSSESALKVGHVVTVTGTVTANSSEGSAATVDYDEAVVGPVTSIDTATETLVVMGQTVRVSLETHYDDDIDPAGLDGLAPGQVIEVSGFTGADGIIHATRLELSTDTEFELTGPVSDVTATTFVINGQLVDYSAAMLEGFVGGVISTGDLVEAEGTLNAENTLLASEVELEDDELPGSDGDEAEVEGMITAVLSDTEFEVNGQAVVTDADTEYEGGTAADVVLDAMVEVEGSLNADGAIVAEEVEFDFESNIEIEAPVEAATATTATVLGIVVNTRDTTEYEDDSVTELRQFSLSDVSVGDWVSIAAYQDPTGMVVASSLSRIEQQELVVLAAPVDSFEAPELNMLGVTVQTDAGTEFQNVDETVIDSPTFFSLVVPGQIVEVAGGIVGDATLLAVEAELED